MIVFAIWVDLNKHPMPLLFFNFLITLRIFWEEYNIPNASFINFFFF